MKLQLHRVGLDGKGDARLTDPAFNHAVDIVAGRQALHRRRPDARHAARRRVLVDADGKVDRRAGQERHCRSSSSSGCKRVELLTYKAADGKTDLYGMLHFPSNFDPTKKYPLLVSVYAGPADERRARDVHARRTPLTEYGFLVADVRFAQRRRAGARSSSTRST